MSDPFEDLIIKIPPLPRSNAAEYLQAISIPVSILNHSANSILIDSAELRFQPEWECAAVYSIFKRDCVGISLDPEMDTIVEVQVSLTPLLRMSTNVFDVQVRYRKEGNLKVLERQVRESASHLILREPQRNRGQLFVSYQGPEDMNLALVLAKIASRFGFKTFVPPGAVHPGSATWEKDIPEAIEQSRGAVSIWTDFSAYGSRVQREAALVHRQKVPSVLLVEGSVTLPPLSLDSFLGTVRFDRECPQPSFSEALLNYFGRESF